MQNVKTAIFAEPEPEVLHFYCDFFFHGRQRFFFIIYSRNIAYFATRAVISREFHERHNLRN